MTMSLPAKPSLINLKVQAKSLLKAHRNGDASCCEVLRNLKELRGKSDAEVLAAKLSLTGVQHALALEYGLPTWAAMKREVLGRTDNLKYLHIHCGDASARPIQNSSVPGDVHVWREIYIEGPVPGNVPDDEFRRIRAEFLSSSMSFLTYDGVLQGTEARYRMLEEAGKYGEVILWFDSCMFDQTILIHLIDECARQAWPETTLSLICVEPGLGTLPVNELVPLMDIRHEITPQEISLAHDAWRAFRSADPTDVEAVLARDCPALPFLEGALCRHLEQYPAVRNGLNRTQNQVMTAVANGASKLGPIFVAATSDVEDRPFMGDTSLWMVIEELVKARVPLLKATGPDLAELTRAKSPEEANEARPAGRLRPWDISITDAGRAVLAGKQDHLRLNGIDRWLGGVHLQGAESQWRWDEKGKKLVQIEIGHVASPQKEGKKSSRVGPVGRVNDDVREKLSVAKIEQICKLHGLPKPARIIPEPDGNDAVVYYLDTTAVLSFHCHRKIFTEIHEGLRIMEGFDEFPSPRLIAVEEEDGDLGMPYIITERCPGERLDRLWVKSDHAARLDIARALGVGMARYHTIDIDTFRARTREASLEHRCGYEVKRNTQTYRTNVKKIAERASRTFEIISALGLDCASVARHVETHLAQCMTKEWRPFAGMGLCHEGAWPDHFFIRQMGPKPELSGCIDFEEFPFADSVGELDTVYCSMLGTDDRYVGAFISGYGEYFDLPPDAAQLMRESAIEGELGCLDHMTKGIKIDSSSLTWRDEPVADWLKRWISNRCDRLEGWFDQAKRVTKPLFRGQVGPW